LSADGDFCDHQCKSEGHCQDQVDQQKNAPSVFCSQVRETPDVSKAHSRTCSSQNKAHLVCKRSSFLFHIFLLCIVCKVCRHNYEISYRIKQGNFHKNKLDFVFWICYITKV